MLVANQYVTTTYNEAKVYIFGTCMKYLFLVMITAMMFHQQAFSQVEVAPWGNITGIRKQGHLFKVETSLQFIKRGGNQIINTAREQQTPIYTRNGNVQTVTTRIDSLLFEKVVTDGGGGKAQIDIKLTSEVDTSMLGAFFVVRIPHTSDNSTKFKLFDNDKTFEVATLPTNAIKDLAGVMAKGFEYNSANLEVKVKTEQPDSMLVRKDENNGDVLVYLTIKASDIKKGETIQKSYQLEAKGQVDKSPVSLTLNTSQQGHKFDGLGGNFRLQNPTTDQQVIDYSLENLRLAWGRVEMPWKFWQPEKDVNPLDAAQANRLPTQVTQAMEMAQRLSKKGIPVILSAWSAPDWAIVGTPNLTPVNGVWGNPLNKDIMTDIYRSITRYIIHLRDAYGVEVKYFSFNESDLGINIRMTAQEHADFIKGFGSYMKNKGLNTKLLLGDNSDANSWAFLNIAIADTATHPYIGAISFHSWRGWETATLQKWADVATKLNVPLLVGEGSIDAAAWQYPAIFQEPTYAIEEINLYTRLLAICQPASILQWQLTADYSPLAGGGIFGDNSILHPTQRFWNLKQLSSTPKDLYAMPIQSSHADVSAAALGDNSTGVYTIHIVNNSADRQATITGIPAKVEKLKIYITNQEDSLKDSGEKKVSNGQVKLKLPARSFVTLVSSQ
jgi:O-glycosyl hydrolase